MKIVLKTTNLKLEPALRDYLEEKINSLEKYLKKFLNGADEEFLGKGKPKLECWVEVSKITQHHQKGPFFRVEYQLHLPKKSIRVEAINENLRLAIDEMKDEAQRELKEYKEKWQAKFKRNARAIKKELKLSPAARFWRKGRILEEGL